MNIKSLRLLVLPGLSIIAFQIYSLYALASPLPNPPVDKVVFFISEGMRQDLLFKFAGEGSIPGLPLGKAAVASNNGMLTEAPANSGSGWFNLSTGASAGVHGSPNNIFHINGRPFALRTAAFDPGVLQAETIAQAAERSGRRVAQIEWLGGSSGSIAGPTVDSRSILSGRGVTTNYISPADRASMVAASGLQFDSPSGFAGQAPYPESAPSAAAGWINVPVSYSPAMEMRMRVLDAGVDKYGQYVYIYDSTDDGSVNYNRMLLSPVKDGGQAVGTLSTGEWADIKARIIGGSMDGLTAGFLVKAEAFASDLSNVRLYHSSVARAIASWPGWPGESGFSGDFTEYIAQRFPSPTSPDFEVLGAGIISEDTYVEQGLYWEKCYQPLAAYIINAYNPDLLMQGYPLTGEFQRAFLGLISPKLQNGASNPGFDDLNADGLPDARVVYRENYLRRAYSGAAETLQLSRSLVGTNPATLLGSDSGYAPQFLAIDASKVLVDLGLLSRPQTSNCRPAAGETIGKAKACWSGGTVHIYLNLAGRDPAGGGYMQVSPGDEAATVEMIRAAFLSLSDPYDWNGDGHPEGWAMIDRVFSKGQARYIPNAPGSFSDMAHPTRTGDVVIFAYPPYQFEDATPGTLTARTSFSGQQGYLPDVRDPAANINMRATFIAFGKLIKSGVKNNIRSIDLAPTVAFLLGIPAPQRSEGRLLLEILDGGNRYKPVSLISLSDFHGQLDPESLMIDGINVSMGGAPYLATLFDEEKTRLPGGTLLLSSGDNVGASPPNSSLLGDMPAIDVENAWGVDATTYGNHEFDYGVTHLLQHQARAQFPFLAVNIVDDVSGLPPDWIQPSRIFRINGVDVGVIGAALESTPAYLPAGRIAGLRFLPAVERIRQESERLRDLGIRVQIVLLHEGSALGQNAVDGMAAEIWSGRVIDIANSLSDTTVDVILAGHTHRISNLMVGDILIAQGLSSGLSYSSIQMAVTGGDVFWAGASSRLSKILGVAPRPDVQAIVDDANAQTAILRNQVIGTQSYDIKRDPTRLKESAMGNLVADAMRARYPAVEAALTNSGGLRADINCLPASAGEGPCEITWGEVFSVLPFGNVTIIETLTYSQMLSAFINGLSPVCDPAINTGRFPQISGLKVEFSCNGTVPVVNAIWKALQGVGGPLEPFMEGDTVRIVTNDFLFGGEDGYSVLADGMDVIDPGDLLLDIAVDSIRDNSPVAPVVDGRIIQVP